MKAYQKLLRIALATAVGVLALPKEANADQISNGTSFNGLSLNGVVLNGASLNGTNLNGTSLNGVGLNGMSFNGLQLNGLSVNGLSFNGVSFNGTQLNGLSFNGTSMNQLSQGTKLNLNPQPEPPGEQNDTGLTLSSSNFTGIKVEGGRLVGGQVNYYLPNVSG